MAIQAEREQPDPARHFTGTLRGGVIAIGAETTGWLLETEEGRLDVDVSQAQDAAAKLEGRRVVVEGDVVMANWVERGEKRLLMADSISPAD